MEIDEPGIPLAAFVDALRNEIRSARANPDPETPIEVGPVSVEFTLLTRREAGGKVGFKFWVVEAGVSGRLASESTQKVTMQLQPLSPDGQVRARVRDREHR